ncbi:hypothetical protein [Hellea balneolensis]|uniref:hypothetical protein n=1 Tax=Hellea balneolensis TaxID=287478 RepID=UPI0004293185|nr:hypothetical protein [Hellea balneolensis]
MPSDYDKQQWQEEQAARDSAVEKQREKERKTRERAARNARRKLERLHKTLSEKGEITDFENEFGESVVERLDKFGSAFHDREKGRPGDALSFAQKRVVAAMNKKVKDLKKKPIDNHDPDSDYERTADRWKHSGKKRGSSFKPKKKKSFTPRVRNLEDDMPPESLTEMPQPFIPEYKAPRHKPFLRIVKND